MQDRHRHNGGVKITLEPRPNIKCTLRNIKLTLPKKISVKGRPKECRRNMKQKQTAKQKSRQKRQAEDYEKLLPSKEQKHTEKINAVLTEHMKSMPAKILHHVFQHIANIGLPMAATPQEVVCKMATSTAYETVAELEEPQLDFVGEQIVSKVGSLHQYGGAP